MSGVSVSNLRTASTEKLFDLYSAFYESRSRDSSDTDPEQETQIIDEIARRNQAYARIDIETAEKIAAGPLFNFYRICQSPDSFLGLDDPLLKTANTDIEYTPSELEKALEINLRTLIKRLDHPFALAACLKVAPEKNHESAYIDEADKPKQTFFRVVEGRIVDPVMYAGIVAIFNRNRDLETAQIHEEKLKDFTLRPGSEDYDFIKKYTHDARYASLIYERLARLGAAERISAQMTQKQAEQIAASAFASVYGAYSELAAILRNTDHPKLKRALEETCRNLFISDDFDNGFGNTMRFLQMVGAKDTQRTFSIPDKDSLKKWGLYYPDKAGEGFMSLTVANPHLRNMCALARKKLSGDYLSMYRASCYESAPQADI